MGVSYSDTFILCSLQIREESNMSAIGRVGGPKLVSGGISGKGLEVRVPSFSLCIKAGKADGHAHRGKYQAFAIAGNIEFCIVPLAGRNLPQPASISPDLPDVQRAPSAGGKVDCAAVSRPCGRESEGEIVGEEQHLPSADIRCAELPVRRTTQASGKYNRLAVGGNARFSPHVLWKRMHQDVRLFTFHSRCPNLRVRDVQVNEGASIGRPRGISRIQYNLPRRAAKSRHLTHVQRSEIVELRVGEGTTVRRPTGTDFQGSVVRDLHQLAPTYQTDVDVIVPVAIGDECH